ncbi:hypothetical protein ACQKGO_05585 [Corallococcus interemptor]|uniref:hypothetical protein n=1 Tax=Corallococcus interemptor TaxID=2316720 RepID=UPI003D026E3F
MANDKQKRTFLAQPLNPGRDNVRHLVFIMDVFDGVCNTNDGEFGAGSWGYLNPLMNGDGALRGDGGPVALPPELQPVRLLSAPGRPGFAARAV